MTSFEQDILHCLQVLRTGGLILYPTDTVWGLGCDATNPAAVEKIYTLKQRANTKSMIVLLAEERSIIKYVTQPDLRIFDYLNTCTKPTTVIFDGAIGLAENLVAPDGSIAVRLVKDDFCKHLIKRFGKPIVSTSANISGEATPQLFHQIHGVIKNGVDYKVQHRQDDVTIAEPSTIIKWNKDGVPVIIRP